MKIIRYDNKTDRKYFFIFPCVAYLDDIIIDKNGSIVSFGKFIYLAWLFFVFCVPIKGYHCDPIKGDS